MATKGQVITAVMREVGDRESDSSVKALHRVWFDDALDLVLSRWAWPYRRGIGTIDVTAAGFETFVVPAEVAEVRFLRDLATRRPLEHIGYDRLLETQVDLTQTGAPTHWYWHSYDTDDSTQLAGLYPLPSDDMTLQYDANLQVALPLADGDTIPVPREVIGILREAMRAYSYENEAQTELSGPAWQRFFARLEKLTASQGMSRPENRRRLREDGDLANVRGRRPIAPFGTIPDV